MSKKIILISIIIFLVLLVQNLIRIVKSSLVVVLIQPEVISFIKFYLELPITFALILLYLNVYNKYSPATIFNFTIIIFIIVFSIFGFWLIPNYEYYRLSDIVINKLIKNYIYLKWILVILQNWVVVMFYVIGELWTPFSYSLLLWELINRITTIKDSKIHYPIFNFFGQLSTSICGLVIFLAFNYLSKIHVESEIFSPRLVRFLIGLVVASTLLTPIMD